MNKLMSVKELAEYLGYTQRTIYNMIERGDIPYVKIGKEYRFKSDDVDKLISGEADEKNKKGLEYLKSIDNPLKKRLYFLGLLTRALEKYNVQPVLIGGNAVEFYTAGGYTTYDIDIASPHEPLEKTLKKWDFKKTGRHWTNEELDIIIEAPTSFLEAHELERLAEVLVDDLKVYIIGIEDIIIDRLNACIHWKSSDDCIWAKEMLINYKNSVDWSYLSEVADAKVKQKLEKLKKEIIKK